jgi:hexosaminidase
VNAPAGVLRSAYDAGQRTISLELLADRQLAAGWRLALTSVVQLTPAASGRLVERLATYHVVEPAQPIALLAGDRWQLAGCSIGHRPRHANDGPVSAYLVLPDGSTADVAVEPMTELNGSVDTPTDESPVLTAAIPTAPTPAAIVPLPRRFECGGEPLGARSLRFDAGPEPARRAWDAVAALAERATGTTPLAGDGAPVTASVADQIAGDGYRITIAGGAVDVTASGQQGFVQALVTLAQWTLAGLPSEAVVEDGPEFEWRGLHVDLARQWFEPDVVERLIDLAAWRKLSRLHLHLTDDEAWRLPVAGYPALSTMGGVRGHGLALPPMLGGGPAPTGRAYTEAEIARWVALADALGVVLVPEIDLPGHAHAALTAIPELRDPDDRSGATSVQFFTDNVLVPGHPQTERFVDAVLAAVVRAFPSSPWIHVGGDEVPDGAWRGSPIVGAAHGDASTKQIEASFHAGVVRKLDDHHGRSVAVWQEAAECGGVAPGNGIVMGWRTAAASRQLAALGHDVVVTPGEAYYLDMATDARWDTPGASWAGATSLDDVVDFEPDHGWTESERRHLVGIQACLWTEHVGDEAALHARLGDRLDAIAERAWRGDIAGGATSLAARAAASRYRLAGS